MQLPLEILHFALVLHLDTFPHLALYHGHLLLVHAVIFDRLLQLVLVLPISPLKILLEPLFIVLQLPPFLLAQFCTLFPIEYMHCVQSFIAFGKLGHQTYYLIIMVLVLL